MKIEYTDWFPPGVAPTRNGLYLLKYGKTSECWHMGYWNGRGWYSAESAYTGHCANMDLLGGGWDHNRYHWRGLTHNDRVEGRDAASSRRVPSHDGLGDGVSPAPTFGEKL